ncbi:MAG: hypothetical protein ACI89X_002084 [Planctomycetota bacterium]|jgi:hypothetical protein
MSDYYQGLDAPHFAYDMHPVDGIDTHTYRGPIPDLSQPYFACIGGAQTMGRFVTDTYANTLSSALGLPCLNLALGGAGPRYALQPDVMTRLQRAKFVIVQVFSGRSASNSRYDNSESGRNNGRCVHSGENKFYEQFLAEILRREDDALLRRIVQETREDFAFSMKQLADLLPGPKVLLWLSKRKPAYTTNYSHQFGISNHYPQLIDAETLAEFRPHYDAYVECAESLGLPQALWHGEQVDGTERDDDGQVWNTYYPTPEMHAAAAKLLFPTCKQLLDQQGSAEIS